MKKKLLLLLLLLSICSVSFAAKKSHDNGPAYRIKNILK